MNCVDLHRALKAIGIDCPVLVANKFTEEERGWVCVWIDMHRDLGGEVAWWPTCFHRFKAWRTFVDGDDGVTDVREHLNYYAEQEWDRWVHAARVSWFASPDNLIEDVNRAARELFRLALPQLRFFPDTLLEEPRITIRDDISEVVPTIALRNTPHTVVIDGRECTYLSDESATLPEIRDGLIAAINAGAPGWNACVGTSSRNSVRIASLFETQARRFWYPDTVTIRGTIPDGLNRKQRRARDSARWGR